MADPENNSRVTCGSCRHFTPDVIGANGVGRCGKTQLGLPPSGKADDGYLACFPNARRRCEYFDGNAT